MPTPSQMVDNATEVRHDVVWGVVIDMHKMYITDAWEANSIRTNLDTMHGVKAKLVDKGRLLLIEVVGHPRTDEAKKKFQQARSILIHHLVQREAKSKSR